MIRSKYSLQLHLFFFNKKSIFDLRPENCLSLNRGFLSLGKGFFSDELKCAEVVTVYKKMIKRIRITTDLSVFCLIYQNYMKGVCINKSVNILNHFYQSFNAVSDKNSVHSTAFYCWSKKWKKLETTKEFLLGFSLTEGFSHHEDKSRWKDVS